MCSLVTLVTHPTERAAFDISESSPPQKKKNLHPLTRGPSSNAGSRHASRRSTFLPPRSPAKQPPNETTAQQAGNLAPT